MKTISSTIKLKTREVKDYISVIQNAVELFELYNANIQLEILKDELFKKRGTNHNEVIIMAEINLASELQELCKRRV
ncbi:MAG: hypothetical protein ABI863_08690 [Ginsengibacter sp.]